MKSNTLRKVNRLQVPTWSALNVNEAFIDIPTGVKRPYKGNPLSKKYPEIQVIDEKNSSFSDPDTPLVIRDTKDYVDASFNYQLSITIPRGIQLDEPVVLNFQLDQEGNELIDDIYIHAEAGSSATVVLRYSSPDSVDCFHWGFVEAKVEENANLKLIKAQMLSAQHTGADATQVIVEQGAHAQLIFTELGSKKSVSGCSVQLAGNEASASLEGIYTANGKREFDLNYRMEFVGKNTDGIISIKGALLGEACKTLKSTLDFIAGASGANGREEEQVLVLSPSAVNISAPLLLCGEDNVSGQHATTTGKPDETKLFYMMSRGISESEARKLIALAAFHPVLDQIEPESLKEETITFVREVIDNAR